jgi:serine/threonine-protein kinase
LFVHDPDRLARFQREAKVLASLNHPNIAHIHGLEESDGIQALVMELVDGEDLAQRLTRGAIPIDEALPIAKQIAEALEAAHEQGIIHRDLKPANIKIRPDGTVKVLDFGLAKALEATGTPNASASISPTITTPAMTQAGVIMGTAAYMSPEQAKGRSADKRSDLWSFGCVLYEMLAGCRTFGGEDVSDTLAHVLMKEPEWSALPATTPAPIRRLLARCLVRDGKRRLDSAAAARLEIDEALAPREALGSPVSVVVARQPRWRRALPTATAVSVATIATAVIMWSLRPSLPPASLTRFPIALLEGQVFTGAARQMVAISPDGTEIAYTANNRIYVRSMSDLDARLLTSTDQLIPQNPTFSTDGRSIVFFSGVDQTLKKTAVAGGTAITLCRAEAPFGISWGPAGIVFGQGGKGILRVSSDGGKPETLVSVKEGELAYGPQMLPGGKSLLFTIGANVGIGQWDKAQIVVQSLNTGVRKVLVDGGTDGRFVPTGHLVYALGGILMAAPFDVRKLELTGGAVPVIEGIQRANTTGAAHLSFSTTGSLVYLPGPTSSLSAQQDLALMDRKGLLEPLKLTPGSYGFPRVSPNGQEVAVGTDDGKEAVVWVYQLSGTAALRRLTFGGNNRFPVWSPDGQRIAFQSDREGDKAIFWQRADGVGTAERLTTPEPGATHIPESWSSPNGERLSFTVAKGPSFSLWMLSLPDKKAEPYGQIQSRYPINSAFSPDGRWVAYMSSDTTGEVIEIYLQPFPSTGTKYQISKNLRSHHPFWSPDGGELWFVPGPGDRFLGVPVTTQPTVAVGITVPWPRQFMENGPTTQRNYDIMPDGKRMVGVIPAGQNQPGGASNPRIEVVLNWFEELKARVPTK